MSHKTYPNGEIIPDQLPDAYRVGNANKKCSNCGFFVGVSSYCSKWGAIVKAGYLCNAWKPMEGRSGNVRAASRAASGGSYGGGY